MVTLEPGQRIGRLVLIRTVKPEWWEINDAKRYKHTRVIWLAQCDCGRIARRPQGSIAWRKNFQACCGRDCPLATRERNLKFDGWKI